MYKICVYAICKNEIKNIRRWLEYVEEADEVVVLDTGSTDGTWEVLQASGVKCAQKIIEPFRFDVARNESLALTSKDCHIYLPLDIDMVLPKNWSLGVRGAWEKDLFRLEIPQYYKHHNTTGKWSAHKRDVQWKYPVFEQIVGMGKVKQTSSTIIIHDWEDCKPSHSQYLKLAEQGIKENPRDFYCKYVKQRILNKQNTNVRKE